MKIKGKFGRFTNKGGRSLFNNGGMFIKKEDRKNKMIIKNRFVICFISESISLIKLMNPNIVHNGFKLGD